MNMLLEFLCLPQILGRLLFQEEYRYVYCASDLSLLENLVFLKIFQGLELHHLLK